MFSYDTFAFVYNNFWNYIRNQYIKTINENLMVVGKALLSGLFLLFIFLIKFVGNTVSYRVVAEWLEMRT